MLETFVLANGHQINFGTDCPEEFRSQALAGSAAQFASGKWGYLMLQQIQRLHYRISYKVCKLNEALRIYSASEKPVFHTSALLQSHGRQTIAGLGRTYLREGQFCSLIGSAWNRQLQSLKKDQMIYLETQWDTAYLEKAILDYRSIGHLSDASQSFPRGVGEPYRVFSPAIRRIVKNMVYSPYTYPANEQYLDELMHQYLLEVLGASMKENFGTGKLGIGDFEKVMAARDFISANLEMHLSTADVARMVGLNEFKLKIGFKQVVGKSIFEYLQYLRLAAVRDEIVCSDLPLKAFYRKAGFADLASFVKGFNTHLGCYPSSLRQESHPDNK